MEKVRDLVREGKRVAKEDPRRVVHSFKVGLVLSLVSSFYYYQPLYDSFGVNAMWAVMTVVVVFEFSVGPFSHSKLKILLFRGLSFMILNILFFVHDPQHPRNKILADQLLCIACMPCNS